MKFNDIFERTKSLWPEVIDIQDGIFTEETKGFYSNNLSLAWDEAEQSAQNEWESLMVWVFYKILHRTAKKSFNSGENIIVLDNINIPKLKQEYLIALQAEGYEEMLKEFKIDN